MDTVYFESLENCKFKSYTDEEMREFGGGCKRWCKEDSFISYHPVYGEVSQERWQRYTLFGKPTDEWEVRWVD